jgi:hypothetical protein
MSLSWIICHGRGNEVFFLIIGHFSLDSLAAQETELFSSFFDSARPDTRRISSMIQAQQLHHILHINAILFEKEF